MDFLRKYNIDFKGLEEGKSYEYSFHAGSDFFKIMNNYRISDGNVSVNVVLIKKSDNLLLDMSLTGYLTTCCNRCLESYQHKVEISDTITVNFDDYTNFDTNESYVILDRKEDSINISQFIYEFCDFALPISCIHPDLENGEPGCDKTMLDILNKHKAEENNIDPRWEELKKIMN